MDFLNIKYHSKIFRPSHGRSHGVTDVIDQHQDVCPAMEPLRQQYATLFSTDTDTMRFVFTCKFATLF